MYLCRYTFATSCFAMRLIVISANRWFRTLTPRPHETIDSKLTERQVTYATKVLLQSSYVSEWILISNTSYRGSSNTGFAHYNVFLRILLLCRHEGIPAQHVWQKASKTGNGLHAGFPALATSSPNFFHSLLQTLVSAHDLAHRSERVIEYPKVARGVWHIEKELQ